MRLIRTVLRPANIGLSRQFQRSQVIKSSSDLPHPVLIETSSLVHGSNIQWCGRSYAASASSEALENGKPRRRISKDERKSMVENYVNKYREMNAGKFPTVSDAQKDVGGSYYVVRQIIQELKYKSELSSVDSKDASLEKSAIKKDKIYTKIGGVSQARKLREPTSPISKVNIGDSSSKSFESNQGPQSSISVKSDKSKDVGTQSHRLIDESRSSLPENNKQETVHENKQKFDGYQPKAEPQESTEISGRTRKDAEHRAKYSVWQNLKSFANGILDRWKRS
ncbi:hypothetical protein DH2020_035363 [Rehmannia glutinosa]|uniref:AT3G52170-like helix-turn-helix domain-containing protein n=1 Tax=Rehmannia glutinosa TaxID=99300 RepID=A0ABR0V7P2_REHGL